MAGESILLVEDNPQNRRLAQFLLKSHGYVVYPRFRTTHVSLSNFWVPLQSLCKGGDYATLVPP